MTDPERRGYERFEGRADEFTSGSEPWWPPEARPAPGSPNVVVMLVDDMGFSDLGPFGGEIETPWADALAAEGRLLAGYHTAPMCSPARASLLTGLNPHRAGFGYVAHIDPGYPGFAMRLPEDAPTLAESLRSAGYATFMVGKWHLTVESELHDGADRSSWPVQRGFDRYFGSMDGFTSLHHPHRLLVDNSPLEVEGFAEGFFLTDELGDRALAMIDELRANDPDRPFLLYFAHTAVHGPLQAKPADIEKYRGRYDRGWEAVRAERLARQRDSGLVAGEPADAPEAGAGIPRWDELTAEERALFARHMEVYAAAVDEVDQSLGRIVTRLKELGEYENTIIVLTSDNGGTAEGGPHGTRSYFAQFGVEHGLPEGWIADVPRPLDLIGGPRVFGHYPAGWARVSNTPFRSFKSSTYEGGVHAPLLISWPAGLPRAAGDDGVRRQFAFVSDLTPTILDLCGVERPAERSGRPAADPDGRSLASVLRDPAAASPRPEQYFECTGRRAYYDRGLKAVSPLPPTAEEGAAGGRWELYDLAADPGEAHDLAASLPERTRELARKWRDAAWRNAVFPLDDTGALQTVRPEREERLSRPVRLTPFRPPLERFRSSRLTVLRSFAIEAELAVGPEARGVVVAHGDQGGGYLLAIEEGEVLLAYNAYGAMTRARAALPERGRPGGRPGVPLTISVRFEELPELRWRVGVALDGREAAALGPVPMLLGMAPFTGISVGYDYGSPVDWELAERQGAGRLAGARIESLAYLPGPRSEHDPVRLARLAEAVALVAD